MDNELRRLVDNEKKNELAEQLPQAKTAFSVVEEQTQTLLNTPEVKKYAAITAEQDIKADLAAKAADINKKNIETAETQFDTETRELRLKQCKAKLALDHKYEMSILTENGKHKQMLDYRKKLAEKYGYLYDKDEKGELIDFSYSAIVNKIRTFTRNVSKLDTTIKKAFKWIFIIGIVAIAITLLKNYQII